MLGQSTLGLVIATFALHALFAYAVYRHHREQRTLPRGTRRDAEPGDGTAADRVDPASDVVECPHCGTENELGYRFCRNCISQLPGATGFVRGMDGPLGRIAR